MVVTTAVTHAPASRCHGRPTDATTTFSRPDDGAGFGRLYRPPQTAPPGWRPARRLTWPVEVLRTRIGRESLRFLAPGAASELGARKRQSCPPHTREAQLASQGPSRRPTFIAEGQAMIVCVPSPQVAHSLRPLVVHKRVGRSCGRWGADGLIRAQAVALPGHLPPTAPRERTQWA